MYADVVDNLQRALLVLYREIIRAYCQEVEISDAWQAIGSYRFKALRDMYLAITNADVPFRNGADFVRANMPDDDPDRKFTYVSKDPEKAGNDIEREEIVQENDLLCVDPSDCMIVKDELEDLQNGFLQHTSAARTLITWTLHEILWVHPVRLTKEEFLLVFREFVEKTYTLPAVLDLSERMEPAYIEELAVRMVNPGLNNCFGIEGLPDVSDLIQDMYLLYHIING